MKTDDIFRRMIKTNARIAACVLLLTACWTVTGAAQTAREFYAAPNGKGAKCTRRAPCSLEGARDKVRSLDRQTAGDTTVYLRGGVYELSEPLKLIPEDSGAENAKIIYTAYRNETPIISGGRAVTGWSLFDKDRNIYRALIGKAFNTRQLYVGDRRAVRARSDASFDAFNKGFTKTESGYVAPDARIAAWRNPREIEIVGYNEWRAHRCLIASIDKQNIAMQQPCWKNSQRDRWKLNNPTWIENAYELLDAEGEWYLDRSEGYLYYKPRAGEDLTKAKVVAPVLETLVIAEGTLDQPVRNIEIRGITFSHATWNAPTSNEGYTPLQAGYHRTGEDGELRETPANVRVRRGVNIRFERNLFTRLGSAALSFDGGSQNSQIVGNVFQDIASHAVVVGNPFEPEPKDERAYNSGNTVANNYITEIGVDYEDACGVIAGYVSDTRIEHNEIVSVPYTGISVGWGWGKKSYMRRNQINRNRIDDYMRRLKDGGGIYTLSDQPDSFVVGNFIRTPATAQNGGHAGLYFDEGTGFYTARDNCLDLPNNMLRGWLNLAHNDTSHDIIVDRTFTTTAKQMTQGRSSKNIKITNVNVQPVDQWTPEARETINRAGLEAAYRDIKRRVVVADKNLK